MTELQRRKRVVERIEQALREDRHVAHCLFAQMVEVRGGGVHGPKPPDPDDRIFLELALVGKADFLVTGDRRLRDMASLGDCRIVSPAEFRAALEPAGARPR